MELTRLKELTAVRETAPIVTEATKKQNSDFDGIRNVVEDALADLSDKIGKGGNLATLFKESGASKLDTYKDADGKTVLAQIIAKTAEFKKTISKLMTEAELLLSQAQMSEETETETDDDDVLLEAKDYDGSSDFTEEFYGMKSDVDKMKMKMKNPRWMAWMKTTDSNFGTDTHTPAFSAIVAINSLDAAMNEIDEELDKAS